MPRNQTGEGHIKRGNTNNPTVGFRCPNPEFKERIQREADRQGLTTGQFLLSAVSFYLSHIERER